MDKFIGKVTGEVIEGDHAGKGYEFEVAREGKDCAFYIDGEFQPVAQVQIHFAPDHENWLRYITWIQMPPSDDGGEAPHIQSQRKCSIGSAEINWSGVLIEIEDGVLCDAISVNEETMKGLYEIDLFVSATEGCQGIFKIRP